MGPGEENKRGSCPFNYAMVVFHHHEKSADISGYLLKPYSHLPTSLSYSSGRKVHRPAESPLGDKPDKDFSRSYKCLGEILAVSVVQICDLRGRVCIPHG